MRATLVALTAAACFAVPALAAACVGIAVAYVFARFTGQAAV